MTDDLTALIARLEAATWATRSGYCSQCGMIWLSGPDRYEELSPAQSDCGAYVLYGAPADVLAVLKARLP